MASNDIQRGIVDENLGTDSKLDLGLPGNELAPGSAPTIQVAQADTGAEDTATVAATDNPATITIELEDGPVVRLPEGTSIDAPRQNGADLEFVQPDGSVVVIAGGAVTGLTIFLGDIQIPPDGVQAIFNANGIEPAEGPGQGPAGDSHGNFDDVPIGTVGDGLNIGDLLPPTELLFGTPDRFEEFAITPPVMLIGDGFAEEDDLSAVRGDLSDGNNEDGSIDAQTVSGSLVSDFGSGGAHPTDALYFVGAPPEGLTSQGEPITYNIVDTGNGQILQAFASSGGEDDPRLVFELELIASGATGSYTFTLYDQLDHALTDDPDTSAVETAFEDIMALGFGIEAQNASGATSDGTLNIGVQDDVPVYLGEGANYYVDEDDIDTDPEYPQDFWVDGNHFYVQDGSLGTSPQDGAFWDGSYTDSPSNIDPGPAYIFGSMANLFSVGSDEFPEERPQEEPDYQYPNETAEVFVSPSSSGGAAFALTADGLANIEALGLASKSEGLAYYLAENGDGSFSLFGYVPGSNPQDEGDYRVTVAEEGSEEVVISDGASGRLVFKLDVDTNGDFEFRLFDQLDHSNPGVGTVGAPVEDLISLDFSSLVTITDYDGDTIGAPEGAFVINVRDDVPELAEAEPVSLVLDEDDIDTELSLGTEIEDGNGDGSYTGPAGSVVGGPATAEADISGLVKGGADETLTFSFLPTDVLRTYLEGLGLMSQGRPLGFDLQTDGTIIGFVNEPNGAVPGQTYDADEGDRQVFEITLSEDGHIKVELYDQLDHVAPEAGADQNQTLESSGLSTLNLGEVILATDYDGDSITLGGQVTISVTDDVPVLVDTESVSLVLDEDDIDTELSLGTEIEDGNGDGSYTGPAGSVVGGPATAEADISGLVQSGADEELTFSFLATDQLRSYLEGLGLMSQGRPVGFDLETNGTIIGFVNEPNGAVPGQTYDADEGDRQVFEIALSEDGYIKVELYDQLDHVAPEAGADQNQTLESSGLSTLNLGEVILATDYDGDSITLGGQVTISVTDDVPVLVDTESVSLVLDEDDIDTELSLGTEIEDGNGDGSYTGPAGSVVGGPATAEADISGLVQSGADEELTFSFLATDQLRSYLEGLGLMSQGRPVGFDLETNGTIIGFVNEPNGAVPGQTYDADEGDRQVFEIALSEDGYIKVELYDQLDHVAPEAGADQNQTLESSGLSTLNLGEVILATDYDGDSITLGGQVTISVTDDVPELVARQSEVQVVDEQEIETNWSEGTQPDSYPDDSDGNDSYTTSHGGAARVTGSLSHLVQSGADENLTFSFVGESALRSVMSDLGLHSQGRELSYDVQGNVLWGFVNASGIGQVYNPGDDRPVFTLTLNEDGSYTFDLIDQLDHDAPSHGADENFDLEVPGPDIYAIDFGDVIKATDHDGDSVILGDTFRIQVKDDVPELVARQSEVQVVDEQEIETNWSEGTQPDPYPDGSDGNDSYTTSHGGAARVTGSLSHLVQSGADENLTFSFVSNAQNIMQGLGLTSQGESVLFVVDGNQLIGYVEEGGIPGFSAQHDRPVLKLTLNEDGSYTFDLIDQLDHDAPSHGADENFDLEVPGPDIYAIDFGDVIKATDHDGDSVILGDTFRIQVKDDIPEIVGNPVAASGTVSEGDIVVSSEDVPMSLHIVQPSSSVAGYDNHYFDADTLEVLVDGSPVAFTIVTATGTSLGTAYGHNVVKFSDTSGQRYFEVQFEAPEGSDIQFNYDHKVGWESPDYGEGIRIDLYVDGAFAQTIADHSNDGDYVGGTYDWAADSASYDGAGPSVTPDTADVDLSGLVAVGADDEITFSLTSFAETAFGSYTSDGEQIMIASDGDVLTGTANGEMVFTLTVTPEGVATFSLYGEFDHGAADPMPLDLGAFVQATDFDGDSIGLGANLFVINVEDGGDPLDISGSISGTVEEEHLSPQMQAAYPVTADGIEDEDDDSAVADDDDVDPNYGNTTHQTSGVLSTDLTITGVDGTLSFGFAGVPEGGNVSMNGGGNLTSGGEAVLFHVIDATHIVGYVNEGGAGYSDGVDQVVFSLDITDTATGAYTFTLFDKVDHHPIASADDIEDSIGIDFGGLIQVSDVGDSGDTATIDNFVVDVIDDVPEALPSSAQVDEGTVQPINAALVLDYSGSITGDQLSQMLSAVKAAGLQLFSSPGNVSITVVAFANGADTLGPLGLPGAFTDYATFEAAIDATNEAELHLRPVNAYGTNYTAAIDELVNNSGYTPVSGESNQIFFLSDGNPDRGMDGSNVLESATASAWDAFVNGAIDINVTAIGVGENINTANLQQVDIDGTGAPIMVDGFEDLAEALLDAIVPSGTSGNVITDSVGTAFGADGGHVLSIAHDGVTYTYDPDTGTITSSGGSAGTDAGSGVLELATALGGTLTFDFTSGEWSYAGPASGVVSNTDEVFSYTLIDGDGDTASADLTITVVPGNAAPVANDDVVLTNIVDGSLIDIPTNALTWNDSDPDGDPLSITGVSNPSGGTASVGSVIFDPDDPTPVTVMDADFNARGDGTDDGFTYADGEFGGPKSTSFAAGDVRQDALRVRVGDFNHSNSNSEFYNRSGGWSNTFNLAAAAVVTVSFDYSLYLSRGTDAGENATVLFSIDGTQYTVDHLNGSNTGSGQSTSGTYSVDINLAAGSHEIVLGAHINEFDANKSSPEYASATFDNVNITAAGSVIDDGSVDYTVSDGELTDTATATIHAVEGNTITGTNLGEILVGGDGDDFLFGLEGDDALVGGLGSDEMHGGSGADLFIVSGDTLDAGIEDFIADYRESDQDQIDLTELLNGVGNVDLDGDGFVNVVHTGGNDYTLQVDTDGGGNDFHDVATVTVLDGTQLSIIFDDNEGPQNVDL